jgi:Zn-dependent protease
LDLPSTIYTASTWIVPILIAITFHEAAHAFAAWKLGDDTAHRLGRVTFKPFKHVDLFGTILLPALLFLTKAPFLFGWAKPVPVAFGRLGDSISWFRPTDATRGPLGLTSHRAFGPKWILTSTASVDEAAFATAGEQGVAPREQSKPAGGNSLPSPARPWRSDTRSAA